MMGKPLPLHFNTIQNYNFPECSDVRGISNRKTVMEGFENVQAALLDYTLTCYPSVDVIANFYIPIKIPNQNNKTLFIFLFFYPLFNYISQNLYELHLPFDFF